MIDDDSFNNIVRRMFEQFFGSSIRLNPYDSNTQMEFSMGQNPSAVQKEEEPFIDVIELDNEIMIVIATNEIIQDPEARITEGLMKLKMNSGRRNPLEIPLPSAVNIKESTMSYSNGILELRLAKSSGKQEEGILTV